MCFQVYMRPRSSVLVPIPLKICVALLRIDALPRGDHGRRLKVVMVEGFPLFATMAFVVCCVTKEGSSTPIKDWFGCRVDSDVSLSTFYHEFCNGKFDDQSKTRNDVHLLL